jgi:hypothetical protein
MNSAFPTATRQPDAGHPRTPVPNSRAHRVKSNELLLDPIGQILAELDHRTRGGMVNTDPIPTQPLGNQWSGAGAVWHRIQTWYPRGPTPHATSGGRSGRQRQGPDRGFRSQTKVLKKYKMYSRVLFYGALAVEVDGFLDNPLGPTTCVLFERYGAQSRDGAVVRRGSGFRQNDCADCHSALDLGTIRVNSTIMYASNPIQQAIVCPDRPNPRRDRLV